MSEIGLRSERGPVLLALMLSIFLVAIDATILSTAVPTIVAELGGFELFPWLFSAYLLAQVATVPIYGKLLDSIGRRPVMFVGIGLFLLGSILSATAWDMTSLIAFRAIQGLGAGAIMPTAFTVASDIYTVRERARAQAYISSVWAVAAVTGPTLGGIFSEFISWRWIFWVNIPLGILALILFWRRYRVPFERHAKRIDLVGAFFLTSGLVLFLLGLLEGGHSWAWASWQSASVFGAAVLMLTIFALVERRIEDPIIAPWVLQSRIVRTMALVSLIVGAVLIGLTSLVPTFVQATTSANAVVAGLVVAALSMGWPISGALAGRVYIRFGFRVTTVTGSSLAVIGASALAISASLDASILWIAVGCFIVGLGMGLVSNPSIIAAQSSVDFRRRGVVSSTNSLARSIGSAFGGALFGAIATNVISSNGGTGVPAAVQTAAVTVFTGVVLATGLLLAVAATFPHVPIADDPPHAG